jgi:DNA-binding GntR family transcriptional regulator
MTHSPIVSRSVLSDQVKERLLQAILDGRYPPGSRIVETRVAREFGTSQAPVREALRDLEALGVIEIQAFRGARVRHPSTRELLEAYVVRSELEVLAVQSAIEALGETHLAELAARLAEMRQAARSGDVHAEAAADAAFHGLIVEIAGSGTLRRVWQNLEPFSRTYITLVVPGVDRFRIAEMHAPILEALRRRDRECAEAAIRRHFDEAGEIFEAHWSDPDPAPVAAPATRTAP